MEQYGAERSGSVMLRLLRQSRNLTLKQVSELSGLSISYLSELERDTDKRPSHDIVSRLADAFELRHRDREELFESYGLGSVKPRAILLIDGRWLQTWGIRRLTQNLNYNAADRTEFEIDFRALPEVIRDELGGGFEFAHKYFVSSEPVNVPPQDQAAADAKISRNEMLFARLRELQYDVIVAPADHRGTIRLRREQRRGIDDLPPPNPVPMVLGSEVLLRAALPNSFDVAVLMVGDDVYRPIVQGLRRLGKRVALVSIGAAWDERFWNSRSETLLDWKPLLLDDRRIINRVEYKPPRRQLECQSKLHVGDRLVWTTEAIAEGSDYYCLDCQKKIKSDRQKLPSDLSRATDTADRLVGMISRVHHRGYGFITVKGWEEFFFHASALPGGIEFYTLKRGDMVEFEPAVRPGEDPNRKQGTARKVWPISREEVESNSHGADGTRQ